MSRSRLLTNHDELTTINFSSLQCCAIWNSDPDMAYAVHTFYSKLKVI